MLVCAATTGAVPVTSYTSFAAKAGAVTTIVPVGVVHVGWTVTLAVGAAGRIVLIVTEIVFWQFETKSVTTTVWVPSHKAVAVWVDWLFADADHWYE